MSKELYNDDYVETLCSAMGRSATRSYVLPRLEHSLARIGIERDCIEAVILLLVGLLGRDAFDGQKLSDEVSKFQDAWRPHLNRVYLSDYEAIRWRFITKYVLDRLQEGKELGRCLDVGCGRGCVTSMLITEHIASEAVGIDAANFESEWRERLSSTTRGQRYQQVSIGDVDDWLKSSGPFDTLLLLYVLHHSDKYRASRTLRALCRNVRPGGRVIVLEDSLVLDRQPLEDPFNLTPVWREWAMSEQLYCLSVGYDAQVVLDFVAVHLLAGFREVRMPCNYRIGSDWVQFFAKLGYETVQMENIGFPEGRDIDVPQAFFVLKPTDLSCG